MLFKLKIIDIKQEKTFRFINYNFLNYNLCHRVSCNEGDFSKFRVIISNSKWAKTGGGGGLKCFEPHL